jgi:hypothetical protein
MPKLTKLPPSSLRPDSSVSLGLGSKRVSESRPYLVAPQTRRNETSRTNSKAIFVERAVTLFPHESEDARLTGSTRSLFRRLLALNLPNGSVESTSAKPVGSRTKLPGRIASA